MIFRILGEKNIKCTPSCGAKHISKSKCTKHTTFRARVKVAMLKKCTPLWHEAHFEVNMYKQAKYCAHWGIAHWRSTSRQNPAAAAAAASELWNWLALRRQLLCFCRRLWGITCMAPLGFVVPQGLFLLRSMFCTHINPSSLCFSAIFT